MALLRVLFPVSVRTFYTAHIRKLTMDSKNVARAQTTSTVLMIRPSCFNFNPLTAVDNAFQSQLGMTDAQVQEKGLCEFEGLVSKLRKAKVNVVIEEDTVKVSSDAVFPNNWISFHQEGSSIVIWPMKAENRRLERRKDLIEFWSTKLSAKIVDYTRFETEGKYLEGTGSLVLDRVNRVAYACESQRTHTDVLKKFCEDFGYSPILFKASLPNSEGELCPIYHTNVMMSVADSFAVVCTESITEASARERVTKRLKESGHDIIPITAKQVESFAGNLLQVNDTVGRKVVVMSTRAFEVFTAEQLNKIRRHCHEIVHSDLGTIETAGGGSARCMIAEVFPEL